MRKAGCAGAAVNQEKRGLRLRRAFIGRRPAWSMYRKETVSAMNWPLTTVLNG